MEDQLTIRLPRDLSEALKKRAAQMQRKPSEVVRLAVKEFLQSPEQSASPSRTSP
jgi:predicted transcriptional regulator